MKTTILLLLLMISSNGLCELPTVSESIDSLSYPELAQKMLTKEVLGIVTALKKVGPQTLPHETKVLRKSIGRVKGLLDLFAYAYNTKNGQDLWKAFRKDLDVGYTYYGQFKDLFDVQNTTAEEAVYNEEEIKPFRTTCLKWTKQFLNRKRIRKYKTLVINPSHKRVLRVKLSRFYWGPYIQTKKKNGKFVIKNISLKPDFSLTGLENVKNLMQATLKLALVEHDHVLDVGSLLVHENSELFHDFRKRVRTVSKNNMKIFPELIVVRNEEVEAAYDLLVELSDVFGALNDKVTAMHLYESLNEHEMAESLKPQIEQDLTSVKNWVIDNKIKEKIEIMISAMDS